MCHDYRLRAAGKANANGVKKSRPRERGGRRIPVLDVNAELQANIDRWRLVTHANAKSKSEKFPPPHQDGTLGYPLGSSHHMDPLFDPSDVPFSSTNFSYPKTNIQAWSGPLVEPTVSALRRKKNKVVDGHIQSKSSNKERLK
ncbi:putative serine/threonine-protein kinase [Sesbania bispinosa]|nr:putative serine/threonine-protein kinase [Sesbania bispinosa]